MRSKSLLVALLVSIIVLAVSVQAKLKQAEMLLPDQLSTVERLPVEGRQGWRKIQRLKYGNYAVDSVNRSLTKGGDLQIMVYEGSKRRQAFSFHHQENGLPTYRIAAATNLRRRAIDVGVEIEFRNKSGFTSEMHSILKPGFVARLELTETRERPLSGTLVHGAQTVAVKGTNKLAKTPLPLDEATGYVFESEGKPIAAVEVINNGAVWISPDIDPELSSPVSAAISALLLFEELRKTLPE